MPPSTNQVCDCRVIHLIANRNAKFCIAHNLSDWQSNKFPTSMLVKVRRGDFIEFSHSVRECVVVDKTLNYCERNILAKHSNGSLSAVP